MDVLSDAITAMRTGRPHSARTRRHAPWGLRFAPFPAAGFHVVLQGMCWLFPPHGEPIALSAGDVVFLPHGHGHGLADSSTTPLSDVDSTALPEFRADRDQEGGTTALLCGAYLLDQARPHPLLAELPEVVHLPARIGRHPALRAAVDLLGAELTEPGPGADAALPALLDVLLLYLLRAWLADQAGQHDRHTGWVAALNDPVVAAALRGIHHDPGRQWTVQELGAHAGLSRAAFAKRFTALVGQPPLAYLTWWRMTLAAQLLRDSDVPLRTVAERTGYASEFAFAKAFKREYGTAPGRYRSDRSDRSARRDQPGPGAPASVSGG
ncbi:AraC family transcriptional regulator [Goodfellowiella coeruleoviolacea]|uniref:AraC-type DNA-binding protein n=1 Tax=Goodfellowiella coeruleoviolacea TaxID=334858 RepID=A0AAE3GI55_9PSEU|nr:AraC family transcriptional regulator [Goodfellowiella coeruleoviolacea]MCP2168647.1 AraC-type DNA-binding protein [Goodfellowiella coeruleoviolacea]